MCILNWMNSHMYAHHVTNVTKDLKFHADIELCYEILAVIISIVHMFPLKIDNVSLYIMYIAARDHSHIRLYNITSTQVKTQIRGQG